MHLKSIQRALVTVLAVMATSFTLVAVAPVQAQAAAAVSEARFASDYSVIRHGTTVTFAGVVIYDGVEVPRTEGTVQLQRKIVGQSAWKTISERSLGQDSTPVWTSKPSASAYYRLYYPGSAAASADYSASVKVTVRRNLHDNWRKSGRLYYGKVSPAYGRRTVIIQKSTCSHPRSSSCRWSVYRAVTTKATSNWSVRLPASRRTTHFRAYVKPSNGYAGSLSNYFITTRRG